MPFLINCIAEKPVAPVDCCWRRWIWCASFLILRICSRFYISIRCQMAILLLLLLLLSAFLCTAFDYLRHNMVSACTHMWAEQQKLKTIIQMKIICADEWKCQPFYSELYRIAVPYTRSGMSFLWLLRFLLIVSVAYVPQCCQHWIKWAIK